MPSSLLLFFPPKLSQKNVHILEIYRQLILNFKNSQEFNQTSFTKTWGPNVIKGEIEYQQLTDYSPKSMRSQMSIAIKDRRIKLFDSCHPCTLYFKDLQENTFYG